MKRRDFLFTVGTVAGVMPLISTLDAAASPLLTSTHATPQTMVSLWMCKIAPDGHTFWLEYPTKIKRSSLDKSQLLYDSYSPSNVRNIPPRITYAAYAMYVPETDFWLKRYSKRLVPPSYLPHIAEFKYRSIDHADPARQLRCVTGIYNPVFPQQFIGL